MPILGYIDVSSRRFPSSPSCAGVVGFLPTFSRSLLSAPGPSLPVQANGKARNQHDPYTFRSLDNTVACGGRGKRGACIHVRTPRVKKSNKGKGYYLVRVKSTIEATFRQTDMLFRANQTDSSSPVDCLLLQPGTWACIIFGPQLIRSLYLLWLTQDRTSDNMGEGKEGQILRQKTADRCPKMGKRGKNMHSGQAVDYMESGPCTLELFTVYSPYFTLAHFDDFWTFAHVVGIKRTKTGKH